MGILDTAIGVALGVMLAEAVLRSLRFVIVFLHLYRRRDEVARARKDYKKAVEEAAAKAADRREADDSWNSGGYR